MAENSPGKSIWRRRAFPGVKARPIVDKQYADLKITKSQRDAIKRKGLLTDRLDKMLRDGHITLPKLEEAKDYVRRVATPTEAIGVAVLNEGVRYPPEPSANPNASRMRQCRGCRCFVPPQAIQQGRCDDCRYAMLPESLLDDDEAIPGPALTLAGSRAVTTIYEHHPSERQRLRQDAAARTRKAAPK